MPPTTLQVGDYAEFYDHPHRITELFCPESDPLTQYARLTRVDVDQDGIVTDDCDLPEAVVVYALQAIAYPTVVLMLAIHNRKQELEALDARKTQLKAELTSLDLALGILRRNEYINNSPDD